MPVAFVRGVLIVLCLLSSVVARAARPAPGNGYESTAVLQSYDSPSGGFRIWYVLGTDDGVDDTDAKPANGIPDLVELVARTADDVHSFFVGDMGFRAPVVDTEFSLADDVGGDGRFDIYLRRFGAGDGSYSPDVCQDVQGETHCSGHFEMEREFDGAGYAGPEEAVRVLVSHEYFHAIQAAYRIGTDPKWSEGTATWAEELYDPEQDDFERLLNSFFRATHRPFDRSSGGSFDGYAYGAAAFPWFLGERFGHEIVRRIWEDLAKNDDDFLTAIDQRLQSDFETSLVTEWLRFSRYNLFTAERADPEIAYQSANDWPSVVFEEHHTLQAPPLSITTIIEGLSARYVPLVAETAQEIVMLANIDGAPAHMSLNVWTDDGVLEVAGWSGDEGIRALLPSGVAYLVLTSASRGAPMRRVDLQLIAVPDEGTNTGKDQPSGCNASDHRSPFCSLLLVLLALATMRRRRGINANANYLHNDPLRGIALKMFSISILCCTQEERASQPSDFVVDFN